MKIVIDIPERVYTYLTKECSGLVDDGSDSILLHLAKGVIQGTVLPKGHGDLVDISKLYDQKIEQWNPFVEFLGEEYVPTGAIETYAPIVIPADKGEE